MRDVRGEAPHLLERLLQTRERRVEHGGEPPHFVVGIAHGQAIAETLRGDGFRALRHPLDRGERPAREHVAAKTGRGHPDRKAKQQDQRDGPNLLTEPLLGAPDLNDHRTVRSLVASRLPDHGPKLRIAAGRSST